VPKGASVTIAPKTGDFFLQSGMFGRIDHIYAACDCGDGATIEHGATVGGAINTASKP
jgi:hypothetical protein